MRTKKLPRRLSFRRGVWLAIIAAGAAVVFSTHISTAASWNNIEPLKSRRADVRQALGAPIEDTAGEAETLRFKVPGATVTVGFVSDRTIAARKLEADLKGTVLQVAVQHENSTETPETLKLVNNDSFTREDRQGVAVFTNTKDGVIYTFVNGKLTTTWYNPSSEQLVRAQSRK